MIFFTLFILFSTPIDLIKDSLLNIDSYTKNLKIVPETEELFNVNPDIFRKNISQFIKNYPNNTTNYRLIFMKGYSLYKTKNYKEAISEFEKVLGIYNELNDYILFYLGECYEIVGNRTRAYQAYALITENSIFFERAVKRKLNILYSLERYQEIKLFFNKYQHLLESISFTHLYANTLFQLKAYKDSILQYKKIWFQTSGNFNKKIEKTLSKFIKLNFKSGKITDLERYNRCEYLLQNRKYNQIIDGFKLSYTIKNSTKLSIDICILKAKLYSNKGDEKNYIDRLIKLPIKKSNLLKYNLLFLKGYSLYRSKKYNKSIKIFNKVIKNYKSYPDNEIIFNILLSIYSKTKNFKKWYTTLDLYLTKKEFKKGKYNYLTKAYINTYRDKKYKNTIKYLNYFLKLDISDTRYEMRGRYYYAKSFQHLKKYSESLKNYISMIIDDPFNYYSYLAFLNIKDNPSIFKKNDIKKFIKEEKKENRSLNIESFYSNNKIIKIYELITLRLRRLAITELLRFAKSSSTDIEFLSLAHFFENLELFKSSKNIYFKTLRNIGFFPNKRDFLNFWIGFYPQRYKKYVNYNSKKFNVSKYYIWSIMREESAYNPKAKSSSNAYGLMQLLYPTALETAERVGMKLSEEKDLYIPAINIPLGTKYLAVLLNMFSGNMFYASASYNGGASNVKKWIKNIDIKDLYDWCEEIPFEETNRYIYKVLGSYHAYRLLYDKSYFKIGKTSILDLYYGKK